MRKFIRECTTKDCYVGAPWLVKLSVAKKYGIDTTLPEDLQQARDLAIAKSKRRRGKTLEEREADRRLKAEENSREKVRRREDKEKARAEKKRLPPIKYPIEDLDLPAIPVRTVKEGLAPSLPVRPRPHVDTTLSSRETETLLMVWAFLSVFSRSLALSSFAIDELEGAIAFTGRRSPMITETHAALLNVIIRERKTGGPGMSIFVRGVPTVHISRERAGSEESVMSSEEMEVDRREEEGEGAAGRRARRQGSEDVKRVGKGWDEREIKMTNERKGWEAVLVGCLNEVGVFIC